LGDHGGHSSLQAGDGGRGLSSTSAPDLPGDEGCDILSKPSASSLHQINHIDELSTRRFVRTVVETARGQPSQRESMSPLSGTISRVNEQHYEALQGAANAIGM
jgi:hypothetical protein